MIQEKLYDSRKHQGFCHMLWQAYPVYFILYIIEREMTRRMRGDIFLNSGGG